MPKPHPKEFREDVIRVARNREPGVHLKQISSRFRHQRVVSEHVVGQGRPGGRRPVG